MTSFTEAQIDQVRMSVDIVDIVGEYVNLEPGNKALVGLCPFHEDVRGHLHVSREKQIFMCFGCGKRGNVFTFVMAIRDISFVEAVRLLAERAGIDLASHPSL